MTEEHFQIAMSRCKVTLFPDDIRPHCLKAIGEVIGIELKSIQYTF